jgi:predicted secreted protein
MLNALHKMFRQRLGRHIHDNRNRRVVVMIECLLNQNARDAGAATFAAMNWPILQLCNEYNVGIVQIPCPEMSFLGFARKRGRGQSIRDALDTQQGRAQCRKISMDIAVRIKEYLDQGYQIVAVLGGNPESPGCAVHRQDQALSPESGVFMRELEDELSKRGMHIPFKGIRDYDPDMLAQDVEWLRSAFSGGNR